MAGLFRNNPETPEGKYLVKRRDGTVPVWPFFVLGASDPNAPVALKAYADEAEKNGFDPAYVADIRAMVNEWPEWRKENGDGDPDAPRHREDDPETIAWMRRGHGA